MLHSSADHNNCDVTPKLPKVSKYHEREEAASEPVVTSTKPKPVQRGCSRTMSNFSKVCKQTCSKGVSSLEVTNSSVAASTHSHASNSNLLCTRDAHCSSPCHCISPVSTSTCPLSCTPSPLFPRTELRDSSVMQLGSVPVSDSLSQTVLTSSALAPLNRPVDKESFDPVLTNQNGFAGPNLSYSSANSSPPFYYVSSIAQQDFNPNSSCCDSHLVNTDLTSVYSTFSPKMTSTPLSVASVPSTTPVSVPNSQTSNFVPCSSPVNFNSYVPSSFNFSSSSFLPNHQTFKFSTSLDSCISGTVTMLHDDSVDPSDSTMQLHQMSSIVGVDVSFPGSDSCMVTDSILSLYRPQGNFARKSVLLEPATSTSAQLNAKFASRLLFESQAIYSCVTNNSSPEIKSNNIFQQFI